MTTTIRRRGRPPGTGKNDDIPLMQVARALVRDPALKASTAMKRVMSARKDWPESDATLLRRWQQKWHVQKAEYLARARQELESKPPVTVGDALAALGMARSTLDRICGSTEFEHAVLLLNKFQDSISSALNRPEVRAMLERMAAFDEKLRKMQPPAWLQSPAFLGTMEKAAALQNTFTPPLQMIEFQRMMASIDNRHITGTWHDPLKRRS